MASTVYLGATGAQQIWVGDQLAAAAYLGDTHVWGPQLGDPIATMDGSITSGRNGTKGDGKAAVGSMSIASGQLDMFAIVFVAVSHSNWLNNVGAYGTFTLTSHLDGQFIRLPSVFCGPGGQRQGSITPFILPKPTVGLHTLTAYCQTPYQWIDSIEFLGQAYSNVLGAGIPQSNFTTSTKKPLPLSVTVPTQVQNIAVCGVGSSTTDILAGSISQPQIGTTVGSRVGGWCDYLSMLQSPLGLAAPSFTTSASGLYAACAVPLVGYPQSDLPTAPKVSLVHTPTGSVLDTTVFDTGAAHYGIKQSSGAIIPNNNPSPDYAATYYPCGRFFRTPANTESNYVEFVVPTASTDTTKGPIGFIGADSSTTPTRAVFACAKSSKIDIYTWTGTKNPSVQKSISHTLAANDVVRLQVTKTSAGLGIYHHVYTVKVNGTTLDAWTDTQSLTFGTPGKFGGVGGLLGCTGWVNYPPANALIGPIKFGDL